MVTLDLGRTIRASGVLRKASCGATLGAIAFGPLTGCHGSGGESDDEEATAMRYCGSAWRPSGSADRFNPEMSGGPASLCRKVPGSRVLIARPKVRANKSNINAAREDLL